MHEETTPVLIVGGGVVGLSMSLFLAWHGVPSVLVERRAGTSVHPRAWGWYPRTLELYRSAGIDEDILEESAGFVGHTLNGKVESLAGAEIAMTAMPEPEDVGDLSPITRVVSLSQDRLEPIVLRRARELGGDIRFGQEMVDLVVGEDDVRAVVRSVEDGTERVVKARYLVAADGARSPIRQRLGIKQHGRDTFRHQVSVLFEADLTGPLRGRRFAICQVHNDTVEGVLGHDDSLRRGTLIVTYDPARGERIGDFTPERCGELVRAAIGVPELPVTINSVLGWEMAALLSDEFSRGPVFLVGDAAHIVPPIGGYGANTGIQDAHNLAWKLRAVLEGTAAPELLDTYAAERRPVAEMTMRQAQLRLAVRGGFASDEQKAQLADTLTVTFGYRYTDAGPLPPTQLRAQPGTRAPHVRIDRAGASMSVLDLFGRRPVLLAGEAADWPDTAALVAKELGLPLDIHRAGTDFTVAGSEWEDRYGTTAAGAVLIRPDGFVSWHSTAPAAEARSSLRSALAAMFGRRP